MQAGADVSTRNEPELGSARSSHRATAGGESEEAAWLDKEGLRLASEEGRLAGEDTRLARRLTTQEMRLLARAGKRTQAVKVPRTRLPGDVDPRALAAAAAQAGVQQQQQQRGVSGAAWGCVLREAGRGGIRHVYACSTHASGVCSPTYSLVWVCSGERHARRWQASPLALCSAGR